MRATRYWTIYWLIELIMYAWIEDCTWENLSPPRLIITVYAYAQQNDNDDNRETTMNAFKREHCLYAGFTESVILLRFSRSFSSSLTCFPNQSRIWNAALTIFSTGICEHRTLTIVACIVCVRNLYLRWNLFRYDFSMDFFVILDVIFSLEQRVLMSLSLSLIPPAFSTECLLYIAQCLLISHLSRSFLLSSVPFPFSHTRFCNHSSKSSVAHVLHTRSRCFFFSFRRTIDLNGRTSGNVHIILTF